MSVIDASRVGDHKKLAEELIKIWGPGVSDNETKIKIVKTVKKALRVAAINSHVKCVKILLKTGINPNTFNPVFTTSSNVTSLCKATDSCKDTSEIIKTVDILLDAKVSINLGQPIKNAINRGNTDLVAHLLSKNANLNNIDRELVHVAERGDMAMMSLIDSEFTNYTGLPNTSEMHSLMFNSRVYQCISAAVTGNSANANEMVDYMIQKKADLNSMSSDDISLLCVAAYKGNMYVVHRLTDAKVLVNYHDKPDKQPLYHAYISQKADTIKYFTDTGKYNEEQINEIKKLSSRDDYWM